MLQKNALRKLLLLFVVLSLFGCDNTLDPINKKKALYSIYGALNIHNQMNYVRVKNLNFPLFSDSSANLNAQVSFKNLTDGKSAILSDSSVTFDSLGLVTHNFKVSQPITPETKYKLTVKRNKDGREVSARTETPAISDVNVQPKKGGCYTTFNFRFNHIAAKEAVKLIVTFRFNGNRFSWSLSSLVGPKNQIAILGFQPADIICRLIDIPREVNPCKNLSSDKFKIDYTHFGPGFKHTLTSDSLNIPGGTGNLIGINTGTRSIRARQITGQKYCPNRTNF